jgi:magnesium-transporting ATPase (P-type)
LLIVVDVGVDGICAKLKVDVKAGLDGKDFEQRTEQFGNNYREPLKAKTWIKLFCQALDDFMLKVLIAAAIFSIIFDMVLADESHIAYGKSILLQLL